MGRDRRHVWRVHGLDHLHPPVKWDCTICAIGSRSRLGRAADLGESVGMTYLLTPTGGRPEALALLAGYIAAQDYKGPFKWIICDDCEPESPHPRVSFPVAHHRAPWTWDGENTQARSMAYLLSLVPDGATIVVMEDDDLYKPDHLTTMVEALKTHDLVGQRVSYYANVKTGRCLELPGTYHASLGASAMKGDATRHLRRICEAGARHLDVTLWREFGGSKRLLDAQTAIGIKGLPGRGGIGIGHRDTFGEPGGQTVRQWIGDELYSEYRKLAA